MFELLLSLLESKPHIVEHFRNTFTLDILLKIFEDYHDEDLKLSAVDTISQLCKQDSTGEIIFLFRKLGGAQKIINQLSSSSDHNTIMSILVCMQSLTNDDQDILVEFNDLNVVQIMLEFLQSYRSFPIMICQILSCLTNLALNDQINIKIRLHGAHIIGTILMDNCPVLIKDKLVREEKEKQGKQIIQYSKDLNEDIKTKHEIQLHCLRTLRFLYSVEKNRKSFKLVFPPEIFGSFIDIGNFNKNF